MARLLQFLCVLCATVLLSSSIQCFAQQYPYPGFPMFSTQLGSQIDQIDIADGNISLMLPVHSISSGPLPLSYTLFAASNAYWYQPGNGLIWSVTDPIFTVIQNYSARVAMAVDPEFETCNGNLDTLYSNFAVVDQYGASHPVNISPFDSQGCYTFIAGTYPAEDGSGYTVILSGNYLSWSTTLYDKSGNKYTGSVITPDNVTAQSVTGTGTSSMTITDALTSSPAVVASYINNGYLLSSVTYTGFQGSTISPPYGINYGSYNVATDFGCANISEIPSGAKTLTSSITTPTNGTYLISYEKTPNKSGYVTGRIASITLPTGGSISYSYSGGSNNSGINCTNYVVPTLTRKVSDNNGHVDQWTYVNSNNSNSPYGNYTVVVTDPANNQAIYYMQGQFQTQVVSFQGGCAPTTVTGCSGGGTVLKTVTTCYNNVFTNCATPGTISGPPAGNFFQTDVYTSYNGGPSKLLETKFNSLGLPTEVKQYDFGAATPPSGTPLSNTLTYYGQSWNGTACTSYPSGVYIYTTPCFTTTNDVNGNTISQTQITYSNSGHATSTKKWTSTSASITDTATYNPNGTVATTTVNGTTSDYYYNGTGGCNGLLPTSVTVGGLTTSTQWNCYGALVTQTTDANGQPTTYVYNDPLFRITSEADALNNTTNFSYPSQTTSESVLNFNGTISTVDNLTTTDGLGRPILSQTRQAQGTCSQGGQASCTFDSTATGYSWASGGMVTTVSMPYPGTAGQGAPQGTPVITTQTDALGRRLTVTDQDGGSTSYQYAQNDVTQTLGPPPSGEKSKQVQTQYDGMGRVQYSCAIGSVAGTAACNQKTGTSSGVTTSYTYPSNSLGQTGTYLARGVQTRSTTSDSLSRVVAYSTPEGGTNTYVYDVAGCYNVNYPGHLTAAGVANGNGYCYAYDALGRMTLAYGLAPSGATLCRKFFYDNSTGATGTIPSGVTVNYPYGRLVEAETDNCGSPVTPITDEWFSYDKDGNVTDLWQLTPHSSVYYHSHATFAGNGVPLTVQLANPSLYTETYGLDGEGRAATLVSGTQAVVSGTTFNAASQPTYIDLGTGTDQSDYVYDPNTGRMTHWTFQVASNTETGALTWNPNGTLRQLVIDDGFFSGGSQTCTFGTSSVMGYDDLGRLLSDNCGTVWAQTFSYDQYDNLTKSGSITWNPGYNPANNHYSSGASYDNSGNLTGDSIHNYVWNQFNQVSSIDSSACASNGECITYDALGRIVETSYNGVYTELWYTQTGKVYMKGSSPYYAYWPTPGGGTVEVNGNNVTAYYMHKDWLGNSRISSVIVNPAVVSDQAYAPYGEVYNKQATGASMPGQMFTGDTEDIIGGIYDTPNRELNASQGRWLSPDPAGAGWNQYAYVTDPLNSVDPTGLDDCDTPGDCDSTPSDPTSGGEPVNPNAQVSGNGFSNLVPDAQAKLVYYGTLFPWCYQCPGQLDPYISGPEPFAWAARDYDAIVTQTNATLFWNTASNFPGSRMSSGAANNGATISAALPTPWYKNSCITSALGGGALSIGIDAIGLIPEAGGLARVIGHQAGYVGVVADQTGAGVIKAFGGSTSAVQGLNGLLDTSPQGLVSTGLTVAGFIPGLGQLAAGASIVNDAIKTGIAISKCQ